MFDKLVEQKIREAIREGEFDNLEGKGRPVNLDAYFAAPEERRAGYAVLKNAGILPEEAHLLRDIDDLKQELEACRDAAARETLHRSLRELKLKYDLLAERNRSARRSG